MVMAYVILELLIECRSRATPYDGWQVGKKRVMFDYVDSFNISRIAIISVVR